MGLFRREWGSIAADLEGIRFIGLCEDSDDGFMLAFFLWSREEWLWSGDFEGWIRFFERFEVATG